MTLGQRSEYRQHGRKRPAENNGRKSKFVLVLVGLHVFAGEVCLNKC